LANLINSATKKIEPVRTGLLGGHFSRENKYSMASSNVLNSIVF